MGTHKAGHRFSKASSDLRSSHVGDPSLRWLVPFRHTEHLHLPLTSARAVRTQSQAQGVSSWAPGNRQLKIVVTLENFGLMVLSKATDRKPFLRWD